MLFKHLETEEYSISLYDFHKSYPLMFVIYDNENYSYFIPRDLKRFDKESFKNHLVGRSNWIFEKEDIFDIMESFYPLDKYIIKIGL